MPSRCAAGPGAPFPGTTTAAARSVLMSRKSTARIDVDGSWTMPIDTGSNADPVTPQEFRGHAFTVELVRDGRGVDPTARGASVVRVPNAENVAAIHEFGDTKFRAVTYRGTATSYYVEYFREQLTLPLGDSYMPFVRFALARYQPHSIQDAHLSKVVLADYAQLAPDRAVTVTGSGSTRTVTVAGYGPTATDGDRHPSRMVVLIEQRDARITDDALAWQPATGSIGFTNPVELSASTSGNDHITWHGTIRLPRGGTARQQLRLTFEEYERIPGGAGGGRLVFTESLPLR